MLYIILGAIACIAGFICVLRMTSDKYSDMMDDPGWKWLIVAYCLLIALGAVMLADGINELMNLGIIQEVYGK